MFRDLNYRLVVNRLYVYIYDIGYFTIYQYSHNFKQWLRNGYLINYKNSW